MTTVTGIVGFACGIARGSCRFVVGIAGIAGVFRSFRVRGGDSCRDRELRARHRERIVQICGRDRKDRWGYFAHSAYAVATVAGIVSFARGIARGSCRFVVGIAGIAGGISLIPRTRWRQLQGS